MYGKIHHQVKVIENIKKTTFTYVYNIFRLTCPLLSILSMYL